MDIKEVKLRIAKIENISGDDEVAHSMEDKLFHEFVESIIQGEYKSWDEIIDVAKELYKVRDIDFERWCA